MLVRCAQTNPAIAPIGARPMARFLDIKRNIKK
nr:MAG TPA: hypothetical protein [Caudoviricetes sp.]